MDKIKFVESSGRKSSTELGFRLVQTKSHQAPFEMERMDGCGANANRTLLLFGNNVLLRGT